MKRSRQAALGAAVVALLIIVTWLGHRRSGDASGPVFADFVGSEACAQCHAAEYAAWQQSTHGQAGGPPSRERVIAPFNGRPIRFRDAVVTPSVTDSGTYVFTVAQRDRGSRVFRVDAVVGGGFMAGGGTQGFFSSFPDGTLRFLPFDYSKTAGTWFCNTLGRANAGSPLITPSIALADCADWPPSRILGSSEGLKTCQQCHGSQIEVAFDSVAKRYETRFTTLAVNCESCHGPGRRHLSTPESGMRSLATLSKDQSLAVCFQCHAVKAGLEPGYLPGKPLGEHFALKYSLLLDTLYFDDGRTRAFAYQEGHLSSDCYRNGSMTCVDCHDPHSQAYRDIYDSPLEGRFDNAQCLDCHPSKAEPLERHTHHRASSAGSRCVSCHMPYLQEPSVGQRIRYARADHTIPIPRPEYDARLGIETACRQCHAGQRVEALQAQVTAWYGELKPHSALVTRLHQADGVTDRLAGARLLLAGDDNDPMGEFAGLAQFLMRHVTVNMAVLEAEIVDRLMSLAGSRDVDVKALALATLDLARGGGTDPTVQRFLNRRLRTLGDRDRAIRERWAWVLKLRGDAYLAARDYENALVTYRKTQELKPNDPATFRDLGVTYARIGDYGEAIARFKQALERTSPPQSQVLVELGFALGQQGDASGAVAAYRQAIAVNPWDASAYANLGVAYLRQGAMQAAIAALEQAVALDPGLADAHFALANAHARQSEVARARTELERGLEFDPRNAAARRLLETLPR